MGNIVFLVGSYVPHQMLSIEGILQNTNHKIHSFSISEKFTFIPENKYNFQTYLKSQYNKSELFSKIIELSPTAVITAGWMIPDYNWLCKKIKKKLDIPVIAISDTPWYGSIKQRINTVISPFHVKKSFSHIWVAGIRQYDYARRLGFRNNQIIFNSLCGDFKTFSSVNIDSKKINYPKNFIYIGRFEEIKGLRNLMKAWSNINEYNGWTFTIIGQGSLKEELVTSGKFIVKDHMNQNQLAEELQNSGCFVLPSLRETWALVLHEAAIAGLPIICTETCGASQTFVINDYNGFRIKNNSVVELQNKLEKIINQSSDELILMSENSRNISNVINPDLQIASILQLINE